MNLNNKEEKKEWRYYSLLLITAVFVLFLIIIPPICFTENELKKEAPLLFGGNLGLLAGITDIIRTYYLNGMKNFNKDSFCICLCCILPLVPLIFYIIYGTCIKKMKGFLKYYPKYSLIVIIFLSFYFWIIYLFRCRRAIIEIRGDNSLFIIKMVKSMGSAVLVCVSASIIFELSSEKEIIKSIYQVVNIFVNAMYPFIDMYTYVRSEIDKFDKQEGRKN